MPEISNLPKGPCNGSEHNQHLCVLTKEYFHVYKADKFRKMVENPGFKCQFCGHTSNNSENLCFPVEL